MKKIIDVHGWGANHKSEWHPWLRAELEKLGFQVMVPDMPDTDAPDIGKWVSALGDAAGEVDENTFFVGHSVGCQAILRYLERVQTKIGGVVFVAPWFNLDNMESEEEEQIAYPWINNEIDFEKIKSVAPRIECLISSNEPYGFVELNKKTLEEKLGAHVQILENRGHFATYNGCFELPEVRDLVLMMCNK